MKHTIRFIILSAILSFAFACTNSAVDESKNLVRNGGFETVAGDIPLGWTNDVYDMKLRHFNFRVVQGNAKSGDRYAVIENFDKADSKLFQRIDVQPNTIYKLSCWVKASNVPDDQFGVNISVLHSFATSHGLKKTDDNWTLVELYGKTSPSQFEMEVSCRVGGYGQESKGLGCFDDFSVYALKSAPPGKAVSEFYSTQETKEPETPKNIVDAKNKTNALFWIVFFSLLFIIIYFLVYRYFLEKDRLLFDKKKYKVLITLALFLFAAFMVRMLMGYFIEGQKGDLDCFRGWGGHLLDVPTTNYYDYFSAYTKKAKYWCDYPPVYIMILGAIAFINKAFALSYPVYTLLIKFTNILADMICCILIYKLAKRKLNDSSAIGLSILYAFNPAIIINSAIWGQADALYTLLALLIAMFIIDDKMWLAGIILGIAILIKIQTAFIAFALLYALVEKKSIRRWGTTLAAGLGTFILLILPFSIKLPWEWIIVQLIGTLTGYPFASVNAYNVFSIFGANWRHSNELFLYIPHTHIGITADMFGVVVGYLMLVFSAFIYFYSKEESKNWFSGLFVISVIYMFIPGMHERYLYAGVLFSLMTYVYSRDRRFLYLFAAYSISVFVNVYHILDVFIVNTMIGGTVPDYPIEPLKNPVMLIASIGNLLLFVWMFKVGVDVYIRKKVKVNKEPIFITPLESDTIKKVQSSVIDEKSDHKQLPDVSPERNLILGIGVVSIVIFPLALFAWLRGYRELKKYPHDTVVRAGWALGLGLVAVMITGVVFLFALYPGLKGAGFLH